MKDKRVNLDKLFLDPNNYRLRSNPDYSEHMDLTDEMIVSQSIQNKTMRLIAGGPSNNEIIDIINSIKSNGFLKVDNILVRKLKNDLGYVVIEGNRRLAALKQLKKSYKEGFEIGKLNPNIFEEPRNDEEDYGVDVVEFTYQNDDEYLILMGLRHVSGNKKWDKYNQAKLIAELNSKGYSLTDIANKIGLQSSVIARQMLHAYSAIQDYIENKELYDVDRTFNPHDKFMIFSEALLKKNIKEWLGWNEKTLAFKNKSNKETFYKWISPTYTIDDNDEDEVEANQVVNPPIIINHKQIRDLDEVINDEEAITILEKTRSINEAVEQNEAYTKKKFSSELKKAEKILANMRLGPTMSLTSEDKLIIERIISLANKLIN